MHHSSEPCQGQSFCSSGPDGGAARRQADCSCRSPVCQSVFSAAVSALCLQLAIGIGRRWSRQNRHANFFGGYRAFFPSEGIFGPDLPKVIQELCLTAMETRRAGSARAAAGAWQPLLSGDPCRKRPAARKRRFRMWFLWMNFFLTPFVWGVSGGGSGRVFSGAHFSEQVFLSRVFWRVFFSG